MGLPRLHITRRLSRTVSLLLAVVLAVSPVLSTAAQTHEAVHAAQGEVHFHAAQEALHGDEMPDAGGMLHVLAHAVHACGHTIAIVGALAAAPRVDDTDVLLPAFITTPADAPRAHPFRPPIA